MKKLHLTFLNKEGKKHKLIPKIASTELTADPRPYSLAFFFLYLI